MSSIGSAIAGGVLMFAGAAAGTYAGKVIPAFTGNQAPAVQTQTKAEDQPINEKVGDLMPGLTAADYFSAGMACGNVGGVGMAMSGKAADARAMQTAMWKAAIKAVGVDPEKCNKI